jgi:xylobiose transport system permease protein
MSSATARRGALGSTGTVRRAGRPRTGQAAVGRPGSVWALPATVFFGLFALVPLVATVWMSFVTWGGIGDPRFVGLDNWTRIGQDSLLLKSIGLTVVLVLLSIAVQTPVSLLLGVWAAGQQRARAAVVAIWFIPLLLSSAAISVLWRALLDPNFGIPGSAPWLFGDGNLFGHQGTAIAVLVFVSTWQYTPFHTLIYQGGARGIPAVLYQAASLDGAGMVRQFFSITLPQLKNTVVTSLILMLVGGLTTFETVLILTNGGPGTDTLVSPLYMYQKAFSSFDFGGASVIAVALVVVATAISLIVVKFSGYGEMRSQAEGV